MIAAAHIAWVLASVPVLVLAGCRQANGMVEDRLPAAPRPARCVEVAAGGEVQRALDDPSVEAVCLAPGPHRGPLLLSRKVVLWGPPQAVVSAASGTVIDVAFPGAAVRGLTVDGEGGRFDRLDGAVRLRADDTEVSSVHVQRAVFGILVERAARVRVVGNLVEGSRDPALGLRGDSIRLWETEDSQVRDNRVRYGRDLVVWYSRRNTISGNRIEHGRYGLHFMYSHDNLVEDNRMVRGVVGIFVMYSRGIALRRNLIADAAGSSGMAIGLKDSGNITVEDNRLIHDTLGLYVDASPMQLGDTLVISRNVIRLCDAAVVFHSSARHVTITDNDLADNHTQVRVDGGGDATAVLWRGNYFDDYVGYDLDGDGIGDLPHEQRSLSHQITGSHPPLAILHGTAALAMIDAAAHLDPLFAPRALLRDASPRMAARWRDQAPMEGSP